MKTIKYLKEDKIELNGVVYKPYTICNLPLSFGCIAMSYDENGIPTNGILMVNLVKILLLKVVII